MFNQIDIFGNSEVLTDNKTFLKVKELLKGNKESLRLAVKEILLEYIKEEKPTLNSPEAIKEYLSDYLKIEYSDKEREYFSLITLGNSLKVIGTHFNLFSGTVDQANVYPREIIKLTLSENASSIFILHNHPSGSCKPSPDDYSLTRRLKSLCKDLDIRMLDHFIIGGGKMFSMESEREI